MINIRELTSVNNLGELVSQIKTYRKRYDLYQGDLALMAGISQPYISKIETGKAKDVPFEAILKIMESLGFTLMFGRIENGVIKSKNEEAEGTSDEPAGAGSDRGPKE